MRLNGLLTLNIVEKAQRSENRGVFGSSGCFSSHVDEVVGEACIEIIAFFNILDVLRTKLQAQSFDVGLEIADFAAT